MINFVQVEQGVYFYCIDCAEKYKLSGKLTDYRVDEENSIKKVQCFLCGKHTQIFIQDKEIKKLYTPVFVSTRPACPICGLGTLTGRIYKKEGIGYYTGCVNTECISRTVFLDENWKVTGATTVDGGFLVIKNKEK